MRRTALPENPVTNRPMASLVEVFGGARNTPAAIFSKSRVENSGEVASHRPNDLAMACPTCDREGKGEVRLFAKNDLGYYCINGHKWRDYDELMSLNPRKLQFKGTPARQDGWEKLSVEMPGDVLRQLQVKYGEKLSATIRGALDLLSQPRFLIIPDEDIKRITDRSGIEVSNASQLVGAIYSLKQTNQQLEEENRLLKANRGGRSLQSATAVSVELGELMPQVAQRAQDWNQEPGEVVADVMRKYIENGWV